MKQDNDEVTRRFILRERLGWLRTMVQYIPPVLSKRFMDAIYEIDALTKDAPNE